MHKFLKVGIVAVCTLSLSGCMSSLSGHTVTIKETSSKSPVTIANYDYQGQKVDQFKTNKAKIKADKNVLDAIDIDYGENRIVHSSSALIAYSGIINYADKYSSYTAQQLLEMPKESDTHKALGNKSLPTSGDIYHLFKHDWPTNGTVVEVKTGSGSLIGCFIGYKASVTDFGSSNTANAIINLDGQKIFVYNASYTLYPISAMKSMSENNKATNKALQANIQTTDGTNITSKKNK